MQWLFDGMAALLAFFYQFIPNYGVAIILLTLVVMIIVTPLTLKGTKSMMMMQRLQPEIRKLQAKHKDDRQKLNEELMAFYKENQLNPVGGCLPLLIQAPVFLVLYTVLRGLTRRVSDLGYATGWSSGGIDLGELVRPPDWLRNFDPAYLSTDTDLYSSLSQTNQMNWLGVDLSESASRVFSEGDWIGFIPYVLLIAVVAVTGFVQQRQIQGRIPKGQVPSQQQMIMKFLPIMLPIFSFTLPGGLVLYFAVSNLYRVGQQWYISRSIYGLGRGETVDSKALKDGGGKDGGGKADAVVTTSKVADTNGAQPTGKAGGKSAGKSKGDSGTSGSQSKGAGGARGRSSTSPGSGKSKTSKGSRSSGQKSRRSSSGGSPSPSVQPRGRKKKR
jgi:YidC/Oxa1 family membrane protein insertase